MRIAIDAHGGDHAPAEVIEAVKRAARAWPEYEFVVVGQVDKMSAPDYENIQFHHTTEKIEPDDEPVRSVRRKKDASMVVGCAQVKNKTFDAFISGGNTGALMAAGLFYTGRLPGVDRPALAAIFPSVVGQGTLVLDVGANPEAKPEHLRQYALMGSIYATHVLGIEKPRVGLLNIGTEAGKGTSLTKEAFRMMHTEAAIHFVGNVEARDILTGVCDVLICDGFSGNVLLKNTEGVAKEIFSRLKQEFMRTPLTKLAALALKPGLQSFKGDMDYKEHGGAPLLGLAGPIIKAHGSSDARAFFNAIRQAIQFHEKGVIDLITTHLASEGAD
ncbi:phosphate acyltransferase PlsX [Hazenella sp. IB182357]|uniref:Phosphate acyltransferase n=1 Tax=Polycladospora coralii TaxID=2771432 RepID=A0A926N7Z9_9BACL|nr:phosphate acyltransferase PlsX [Polycladospora coralii]MBD1371407.1 phosphate acyltransferase PlsX [Polycladospora coralii]